VADFLRITADPQLSAVIPDEIHMRVKVYAAEKRILVKDVVAEALRLYLDNQKHGVAA
jgi:hypothetical protein